MRTATTAAVAALLAAGLVLMPAVPAAAGIEPEEPPVPAVLDAKEEERKLLVDACERAAADKDEALFANALHDMESRRHDDFVPWIEKGLASEDPSVLASALRAAAAHELASGEKPARKLLRAKPKGKRGAGEAPGAVAAAAIDYLARMGKKGEEQRVFEDHLEPLYRDTNRMAAPWSEDLLRAACHYLGMTKYKPAVPLLVEQLEEPICKDPTSPTNPPASYWEARWKLWKASEGWMRWALREITGQEFRTFREWTVWVERNKKDFK